ncbi:MAG: hypothetical protein A2Z88_03005 [Omnitrophica WOR_2 bacterium GWA2_47_8]|nr:MAG: hypothetical protein A2Z88_03005 [Omnitrophica WOR_2 bacterium GWA2_47_8]
MTKSDPTLLNEWLSTKEKEWENLCTRCGACCGALDDPCENLRKNENGKYFCAVYDRRFGTWKTVSGKELNCIPIREKLALNHSWPGDEHCGYKKR